jgi:hypothetical protein
MYQTFQNLNLIVTFAFGPDLDPIERVLFGLVGPGSVVIFLN